MLPNLDGKRSKELLDCPPPLLESGYKEGKEVLREDDTLVFGSVVDIEHAGHSVPGDNPEAFEAAVRNSMVSDGSCQYSLTP
jgi:pimeloyl-ACP methyl ester carboxylesterase